LGIKTSWIDEFTIIILEINLFGSIKIREIDLWEHHLGTILNWLEQLLVMVGSFRKIVKVENGFILFSKWCPDYGHQCKNQFWIWFALESQNLIRNLILWISTSYYGQ
jgi:hypothetical protein